MIFTCIKNAISRTKLFRYPRTRLTTPLATADDPASTWAWKFAVVSNLKTPKISCYKIYILVYNLPPSNSCRENNLLRVLDPEGMLIFLHSASLSMIPDRPKHSKHVTFEKHLCFLFFCGLKESIIYLGNVWYQLKSWISEGIISIYKAV